MNEIIIPKSWKPLIYFLPMLGMAVSLVWLFDMDAWGRFWGWFMLLMVGPLFIVWLVEMLKGEPALVINDQGILDNTKFFKRTRHTWGEIHEIRRTGDPYLGKQFIDIRTPEGTIAISEDQVGIDLEALNRNIKRPGKFRGKARVNSQYRNTRMTVKSFELTLLIGVLFAFLMIGAIFLTMIDLNFYLRLVAYWPISFVAVLVFWYFPDSLNPRFRTRGHPPIKYLLSTSFAVVALVGIAYLVIARWTGAQWSIVLGIIGWVWVDHILRDKFSNRS